MPRRFCGAIELLNKKSAKEDNHMTKVIALANQKGGADKAIAAIISSNNCYELILW